MGSRMNALAAALLGVYGALAVSITSNTTVTEADVAEYLASDIDIASGATLTFSNLSRSYTFSGKLTGAGTFFVSSDTTPANVTAANATRIVLNGDATAFTGTVQLKNHLVTVVKPSALGSATFVQDIAVSSTKSYLMGPGTYTGAFSIYTTDSHPNGFVLSNGVEVAGAVTWRGGRLCGPGIVSGPLTINSNKILYGQDSVHFAGGIYTQTAGTGSLTSDSGVFYIDSQVQRVSNIASVKQVIHFGYEDALDPSQSISIGAG